MMDETRLPVAMVALPKRLWMEDQWALRCRHARSLPSGLAATVAITSFTSWVRIFSRSKVANKYLRKNIQKIPGILSSIKNVKVLFVCFLNVELCTFRDRDLFKLIKSQEIQYSIYKIPSRSNCQNTQLLQDMNF